MIRVCIFIINGYYPPKNMKIGLFVCINYSHVGFSTNLTVPSWIYSENFLTGIEVDIIILFGYMANILVEQQ